MLSSKTRITVLALTGALALTGVAEGASKDKLTIKGPNGDFQGTIKAKKRKCMKGRGVHVFMVTDQGAQEIGSDSSELNSDKSRGLWSIGNSGYKNGRFFARADAKGQCSPLRSKTIAVVTPDAEEDPADGEQMTTARTVRAPLGSQLPHVVSDTAVALEVDGADGGYGRQKCEGLLDKWNDLTDRAMKLEGQANGQGGPEATSAASYMEQAEEAYADMSDNCLIVD
jgi:hypothetical protein